MHLHIQVKISPGAAPSCTNPKSEVKKKCISITEASYFWAPRYRGSELKVTHFRLLSRRQSSRRRLLLYYVHSSQTSFRRTSNSGRNPRDWNCRLLKDSFTFTFWNSSKSGDSGRPKGAGCLNPGTALDGHCIGLLRRLSGGESRSSFINRTALLN